MKILVVDDSQVMRNILIKGLREIGAFNTEQAENGLEAMRKVSGAKYNFAIIDIMMPKMNGIELVKHIKVESPDTKIIICSSVNEKETVLSLLKMGINDFILKPFSVEKLQEVLVRNVLPEMKK